MSYESEQVLEQKLIEQLQTLDYSFVTIKDEKALLANLKQQLEKHNHVFLSDDDFQQVLHHLHKGNIFDRASSSRLNRSPRLIAVWRSSTLRRTALLEIPRLV